MNVEKLLAEYQDWVFSFNIETQKTHNGFLGLLSYVAQNIPDLCNITKAIETGTHTARSTVFFAQYFSEIYTVEVEVTPERMEIYRNVKQQYPNIFFYQGTSDKWLRGVLKEQPDTRFFIVLDAHHSTISPLREELIAIKECSNVKDHVIIIDDGEDLGHGNEPTYEETVALLRDINPGYNVYDKNVARKMLIAYVG